MLGRGKCPQAMRHLSQGLRVFSSSAPLRLRSAAYQVHAECLNVVDLERFLFLLACRSIFPMMNELVCDSEVRIVEMVDDQSAGIQHPPRISGAMLENDACQLSIAPFP